MQQPPIRIYPRRPLSIHFRYNFTLIEMEMEIQIERGEMPHYQFVQCVAPVQPVDLPIRLAGFPHHCHTVGQKENSLGLPICGITSAIHRYLHMVWYRRSPPSMLAGIWQIDLHLGGLMKINALGLAP